ncbi:hypothetical protein AJ80_04474 [Polytolypa hystricis UAMH7299]|uniref:Autophagy-related protein 14 n=1 Tax=Polytolypa hystricis (strain UAMH7299) TaxID=1447883 RepID=A0A2B7Y339_POLH7|nr:hypothetical protein AJ80_04474 [Polytolypa hystricis UAMH7299]
MTCHVCSRGPNSRLQFYCPTCARNQLYCLRFEHTKILLERDAAGQQIEATVTTDNAQGTDFETGTICEQPTEPQKDPYRCTTQALRTRSSQSSARTQEISTHIDILKKEIAEGKNDIARRKAALLQRRSDAESATYQLMDRRATRLAAVQDNIKKTEQRWNAMHNRTAESRIFLCREAASLYRLRQRTRRRNGEVTNSYTIGSVGIVDLRDMNGANPLHLTTSLSHISHLLVLVSHYLSLRLPAEISLPHRGYPFPTIFSPSASYQSRDAPFPGSSPPHSSSTSPTASRTVDTRALPRPRPLYVDKALPKLAKEDPATYALFLEGVTLLAWNVSWVCRTQGLNTGYDSWEDICDVGRNLWQLLATPTAQPSALVRVLSSREQQNKAYATKDPSRAPINRNKPFPMLGHYSHGTAHSFLGAAEGTEFMKSWKLPSPIKVVDKIKSALLGEMASAEWEILEETEWDDENPQSKPGRGETPLLVPTKSLTVDSLLDNAGSIVAVNAADFAQGGEEARAAKAWAEGTRGWTKLKPR